jgi:hypothetical protein
MHSMIVFRMDKSYVAGKGKKPLEIILDLIKEYTPADIKQNELEGIITFQAPGWDVEVMERCPINDPDNSAITVTVNQIPTESLLMHRLMLLNKDAKTDVIKEYKELYPNQETKPE